MNATKKIIQYYQNKSIKINNKLRKFVVQPNFHFPDHNIIKQTLKWRIAHKIRKIYQENNNINYDCIIRTRCDLCLKDNNYKIVDGPNKDYKQGGIYHNSICTTSLLLNKNIDNINKLFKYYNIDLKKDFSILQADWIFICSENMANIEIDVVDKLFYAYTNIFKSKKINDIIKKFNTVHYVKPLIFENNFNIENFQLKKETESIQIYLNKCFNRINPEHNSFADMLFSKNHTFCNEMEINSRFLLQKNNKHYIIDYFIPTKYFKGWQLIL